MDKGMIRQMWGILLLALMILTATAAAAEMSTAEEAIRQAILEETGTDYVLNDSIPAAYLCNAKQQGTIEEIHYTAHDYCTEGTPAYEKRAYVYLPFGYDPEGSYRVMILCHGIGGNEKEWGLYDKTSRLKKIMDNLIENGEIEPFIVVTPNGRGGRTSDYSSFYYFGQELRNDLLPWLDEHYATAGRGKAPGEARDCYAMAGLSMGGMQTINIGMCECLDLFGWFGAFSAAPTSYSSARIAAEVGKHPELAIRFFYNICGTDDQIAYESAAAAAKNLTSYSDRFTAGNYVWTEKRGGHDFAIWYLGFYNFAKLFGAP